MALSDTLMDIKHIYRAENVAQLAGYVSNIEEALGLILSTIGQKQKTCYL